MVTPTCALQRVQPAAGEGPQAVCRHGPNDFTHIHDIRPTISSTKLRQGAQHAAKDEAAQQPHHVLE